MENEFIEEPILADDDNDNDEVHPFMLEKVCRAALFLVGTWTPIETATW